MAEKEYIEREALQNKAFGENHPTFYDGQDIADWYEKCINEIPAADVAPVVRCKDCVLHGHCSTEDVFLFSRLKSENAFCCVGKRKENGNG